MNTLNREWDSKIQNIVNKTNSFAQKFGINSGILNPHETEETLLNESMRKQKAVKLVTAGGLALASFLLLPFPLPVAIGTTTGLIMGKEIGKNFFEFRAKRIQSAITVQRCFRKWKNESQRNLPAQHRPPHQIGIRTGHGLI